MITECSNGDVQALRTVKNGMSTAVKADAKATEVKAAEAEAKLKEALDSKETEVKASTRRCLRRGKPPCAISINNRSI
ncbi:hypothetical protein CsSME_00028143 [Camellia sinensis var. sinensis]